MKYSPIQLLGLGYAALALVTAGPSFAQTASGDSVADIAAPSSVTRLADLNFGDIISGNSASTVIVEPFLESRTVATGDAIAFGGTVSAAEFEVNAQPLLFYQIVLPNLAVLTRSGGTETLVVDNFTLDGLPIRFLPLFTNIGNFKVGGRLHVGPDQQDGAYEGSFSVTVNYL